MKPKIVIENKVPFIKGALDEFAEITYLPSEGITPEVMVGKDGLITRTRTRCNAQLLDHSRCTMVATATIGLDHIDQGYCASRGIEVANAPGCNAPAVAQWVLASAIRIAKKRPELTTLGIVGVGYVGKIVESWGRQIGYKILLCDPPRAREEGSDGFVDLATIAREADIITFHTPLTREGEDATYHLADDAFFESLERRPIIMNAARGPVVDTQALIKALKTGRVSQAAIDVWEGEPSNISHELLNLATIATPHIAGYSFQGKVRATDMALKAVCKHFGFPACKPVGAAALPAPETVTMKGVVESYDPFFDTEQFTSNPSRFEWLRDNYAFRAEP